MLFLISLLLLPIGVASTSLESMLVSAQDPFETMDARDARAIKKHLPGIVIGPVKGMAAIDTAEDWCPLKTTRFTYQRPGEKEKMVELLVQTVDRAPGSPVGQPEKGWALELPNGTTRYFRSDPKFGIVAPTDLSKSNGLIIRLDPPEPIVHQGAKINEPVSRKIKVDIYDLHSPKSVAHSGNVTCTWTDLGGWRVKVPMGEYDTRLVKVEYNGSVGPASVNGSNYVFLAKGEGVIAYSDGRDISAFIIFNLDDDTGGVLKSVEGRSPTKPSKAKKPNKSLKKK